MLDMQAISRHFDKEILGVFSFNTGIADAINNAAPHGKCLLH